MVIYIYRLTGTIGPQGPARMIAYLVFSGAFLNRFQLVFNFGYFKVKTNKNIIFWVSFVWKKITISKLIVRLFEKNFKLKSLIFYEIFNVLQLKYFWEVLWFILFHSWISFYVYIKELYTFWFKLKVLVTLYKSLLYYYYNLSL